MKPERAGVQAPARRCHRPPSSADLSTITAIATSGLRAADAAMRTSAHNLANLQTEGFRRERVVHTAQADGGVMTSTVRAQEQGSSIHEDLVAQLQCPRRPNFDPPCRLNFDPGLGAGIA